MSELQRRVAEVLLAHRHVDLLACACGWGPPRRSDADLAAHQSDAVVADVAAWLRGRAVKLDEATDLAREAAAQAPFSAYARLAGATSMGAAGAPRKAADEIDPKGGESA